MSKSHRFALVAAVGCLLTASGACMDDAKPPVVDEMVLKAFIDYLAESGIHLKKDPSHPRPVAPKGGYEAGPWVVTDPKSEGYDVIVYFKTFPPGADANEMQAALQSISLSGMLCARARLAMSKPGLRGAGSEKLPRLDDFPVAAKLESLFKNYRPSPPKK